MSALVTLFANILQNPQDPRARADVKLMNLVVNFLEMLVSDEENGSVKRMLGVCAEFERIAKVVLDKAERDSHARRKRKPNFEENTPQSSASANRSTPGRANGHQQPHVATPNSSLSPTFNANGQQSTTQNFDPAVGGSVYSPPPGLMGDIPMMPDFNNDFSNVLSPNQMPPDFGNGMPTTTGSPLDMGAFQQPFVPQDLWQMPMTLEWDWADMTSFDQHNLHSNMQ